jgi:SAM-dependent methyltransferase
MPRPRTIPPARAEYWRTLWERQQNLLIPDRELRFDAMLDWLEAAAGRAPRCLDLGCGTGALTERILRRLPRAHVVAVDWDPVTRRLGQAALGKYRGRVRWVDVDLRAPKWSEALPSQRYDAALSSTALHWLRDAELARLYRDLHRLLRPGGLVLNADRLSFDRSARRLRAIERALPRPSVRRGPGRPPKVYSWEQWWTAIGRERSLRRELELHRERFPTEHTDASSPGLLGHTERLRKAGFAEVEVVYARGASRLLAALR